MKTVVDSQEFSKDEYNIAIIASLHLQNYVAKIQNKLQNRLGDTVVLMPLHGLHMTVMEIIYNHEYQEASRHELFSRRESQYRLLPKAIASQYSNTAIKFDALEVSKHAIILRASDSAFLNNIRSDLLKAITLPSETKKPPDITHCTIARFAKEVDLEEVRRLIEDMDVNVTEQVSEFKLLTNVVPPRFDYTVLESFALTGDS